MQQKLTLGTIQFGIEPTLAGLFRPDDRLPQNFQPAIDLPCLCSRHGDLHGPKWFTKVAVVLVKQCPASAHVRESGYSVAGTPLRQAVEVGAGGKIQRHGMLAGEGQDRLRLMQHASAKSVENGLLHERVCLSKPALL